MILDAQLLPDESDEQARERDERRALARANPHAVVEMPLPDGTTQIVPVTKDEHGALAHDDQLYIAFYNMSGQVPDRDWDFSGLEDITAEERHSIARYTGTRYQGIRAPNGARLHFYLTDGTPMKVDKRVAIAPMKLDQRRRRWSGEARDETLRCMVTWDKTAWVTHFAIGSRKHGIIMGAALNKPMPVLPGGGFKFGLKVSDLDPQKALAAGQKTLETGPKRRLLTDGER